MSTFHHPSPLTVRNVGVHEAISICFPRLPADHTARQINVCHLFTIRYGSRCRPGANPRQRDISTSPLAAPPKRRDVGVRDSWPSHLQIGAWSICSNNRFVAFLATVVVAHFWGSHSTRKSAAKYTWWFPCTTVALSAIVCLPQTFHPQVRSISWFNRCYF